MKKITMNQNGMSSILFAMVFAIILSLVAIGFVTLVVNDQRQTLDKTLSYQASYAAETAVNRKAAELQNGVTGTQSACQTFTLSDTAISSAGATITCLTWTDEVNSIQKDNLSSDPFVTRLKPKAGSFTSFTISWSSSGGSPTNTYGNPGGQLPSIVNTNMPIIRVAVGDASNISNTKIAYLVPSNTQNNIASGFLSGTVGSANCSAGSCSVTIGYSSSDAWLSLVAYGPQANITGVSLAGAVDNTLTGAQAEIDANARAQDVTKRIKTRVSIIPQTWNPGAAVSANQMCKDFKVDGSQNASASGAAAACGSN